MRIYYSDHYVLPLPPGHRFPMSKYARLRSARRSTAISPPPRTSRRPHATRTSFVRIAPDTSAGSSTGTLSTAEQRAIGFPWTPQMVERSRRSSGATVAAARAALDDGVAVNLAGGTHHAFRDRGEGFCVFNDSADRRARAAGRGPRAARRGHRLRRAPGQRHRVDLPATIRRCSRSRSTARTTSRSRRRRATSTSSSPTAPATGTTSRRSSGASRQALERARPDLAIYLAGADPYDDDRLGRLALTKQGLLERDRLVLELCGRAGVPVAVTMAGGYARDIDDTVEIHGNTVETAAWFSRG